MKRKQKSCQNEPSAGRFDGPRTCSDQWPDQIQRPIFQFNYLSLFVARVFFRLRRKSVKKTEVVSVKKISLFDPGVTGRVWKFLAKRIRFFYFSP
jgi:hypothetical protein